MSEIRCKHLWHSEAKTVVTMCTQNTRNVNVPMSSPHAHTQGLSLLALSLVNSRCFWEASHSHHSSSTCCFFACPSGPCADFKPPVLPASPGKLTVNGVVHPLCAHVGVLTVTPGAPGATPAPAAPAANGVWRVARTKQAAKVYAQGGAALQWVSSCVWVQERVACALHDGAARVARPVSVTSLDNVV